MKAKMDVENRNEKYSREDLESFVNGIISASKSMRYIHSRSQKTLQEIDNPYYVVNLHGSLPLFDVLTIVDQDIDVDRAVYFPGSSRIQNSSDILRYCFENFLWEINCSININILINYCKYIK